ncbi:unnamed protein product [Alopecurus aequalis]
MSNYLLLKGMGIDKFVSWPVFRVGGYDWEVRFYPDGESHDCAGRASSFLRYHSQAKDVCARFALSMLETKSQTEPRRAKLKSMSLAGYGCFTIRCVLIVRYDSPPLELPGHLECMLGDGRGADVIFCVGGEKFSVDRSLLAARLPIFMAQLFGPMAERDLRHVEVVDMEPAIFHMMLRYIYTDSLAPQGDHTAVMQHLLVAADRYALDRLKEMCEGELCQQMDVETVTSTLALANQHQCEQLKTACMAFMETDGFKEHLKTCSNPMSSEGSSKEETQPSI